MRYEEGDLIWSTIYDLVYDLMMGDRGGGPAAVFIFFVRPFFLEKNNVLVIKCGAC